jgi:hypothetical protein
MTKFLFVYHGGNHPENPEEVAEVKKAWTAWFESMGDAVVDGGSAVGKSHTVHRSLIVTSDGGTNPASGYSVIQTETKEDAIAFAKQCPIIKADGDIEIADIIEM